MNKFRTRLLWKLYLGYVVLIGLTTATVGWLVHDRIAQDSLAEIRASLFRQTEFLGDLAHPALEGADPGRIGERIRSLGDRTGTRLTVISLDGTVLADSHEDPLQMDNHAGRPEISRALEDGVSSESRYSRTLERNMMYCARRVEADGRIVGIVRASLPLTDIDRRLSTLRTNILLGMSIALALGLVLGLIFARSVTAPLEEMTCTAEAIAGGDYRRSIRVRGVDEIGILASALNRMANNMADRLEEISRDRNQLQALLASMAEGVIAADKEERIVHVNAGALRLCRIEGDPVGMRTWEALRIPTLTEAIRRSIVEGIAVEDEITVSEAAGDQRFDLDVTPWHDGSGEIVGAVATLHDMTELRRLEGIRRDFVANASHELKSPITAIRGIAETMLDNPDMDAETRGDFIVGVHDEAMRMSALVMDLLHLSGAERGERSIPDDPVDLNKAAKDVTARYQSRAEESGVDLSIFPCSDPLPIGIDAEQLESVIGNLVENALSFTEAGGEVAVTLQKQEGFAVLTVSDTGVGIPAEHLDRIFERFYRVDKARSRKAGGTGLGLSIVKHVVQVHGGEVKVESVPGEGSSFSILLPLALEV